MGLEQPAIWPAPDLVAETAEQAAAGFVTEVLGVAPTLGPFERGDNRSGEIEVFSPGEDGRGRPVLRGRLLLRQLGPADGWFVVGAVSEHQSISVSSVGGEVGSAVRVEGQGRGFEGAIVISAFLSGRPSTELDQVIASGGVLAQTEPFEVTLDLTGAPEGETVVLLARGGTGVSDDPGEFAAIPVVVSS